MTQRDHLVLAVAAACFLIILIIEQFAPANVVGAYGYVLPILLVAILRNRTLMLVTVLACVLATYSGLLQPTKPGRFQAAVINRSVVVGVLLLVAVLLLFSIGSATASGLCPNAATDAATGRTTAARP